MNFHRLLAITRKEFLQLFRDKPSLMIALALPLMMIFLFGYAINTDVDHVSTAVLDQDKSPQSREMLQAFTNTGYFNLDYYVAGRSEIEKLIDEGKAKIAFVIPPDYSRKILNGQGSMIQIIIDGSDPMVSREPLNVARSVIQEKSAELGAEMAGTTVDKMKMIEARPRVWYNPAMNSTKFNIPGLIGLIMQNVTIMLTAFAMVRERERGTLEQLIVTPIRPAELILGKLIPYVCIAFTSVAIVMLIGTFWFGMEIEGSLLLLLAMTFIFLLGALGLGLLISTVSKTQLQAMQMSFAIILPSVLLSGFMFPRDAMPFVIQLLGYLIPLTYFLEILRGIILKGVGLYYIWENAALLAIFGMGILALATKQFHKKLD